ncbi:MAG: NAD-glutamate dehydrogenase, partial [Caulobacteraceae bacterium]|nr:NAD-glutamate dehydrogenase [Caulobacteraceae bacterium]
MSGAKTDLPAGTTAEALSQAFARRLDLKGPPGSAQASFLAQIVGDLEAEELPAVSVDKLAAMFAQFWQFGEQAKDTDPAIRMRRWIDADGIDLGRDLLEIVQADRPFLVDSIMGQVAESGLPVRAMFHPVTQVGGKTRSMIQVHLDPVGEDRAQPLIEAIFATLADVRSAVDDFAAMQALIRRSITDLAAAPVRTADADERAEHLAFLEWLEGEHFVFLGARIYDYPRTPDGGYAAEEPLYQPEGSLGVLRDQNRAVLRRASEPAILTSQIHRHLEGGPALTVAKSNLRSLVHRRAYMDYVGIKRFGADGLPSGEVRFVGLFT